MREAVAQPASHDPIWEAIRRAAIALANGCTLVTHNTAEFSRVSGLTLEDWQVP